MNYQTLTKKQQLTVKLFQNALIELLDEKPIDEITVVDLCKETGMNRSTFYRYFLDIIDLKDSTVEELFREVFAVLGELPEDKLAVHNDPKLAKARIRQALKVKRKNKILYQKLICENYSSIIEKELEENLTLFKISMDRGAGSKAQKDLCYSYICGGLSQIWIRWIDGGCETPIDDVAEIVLLVLESFYGMLARLPG